MTDENFSKYLSLIQNYAAKPPLFEPGELHFWDDPHISKGMLTAHLDETRDAASRKRQTIDETIEFMVSSNLIRSGELVLDLGCGPGLYASRLCQKGVKVTGIDKSPRSIDFAKDCARDNRLVIDYRCMDFFDIDFDSQFDTALQIYGELNTFSDKKRDAFLAKVFRALKPDGRFMFDVTTRAQRLRHGLRNRWYVSNGGFWRPGRHLVLELDFDYPENDVWLDQFIVVDESGAVSCYRNWFHDYTLSSIEPVLKEAGFQIVHFWNDLVGTPYVEGGDWFALVVQKNKG